MLLFGSRLVVGALLAGLLPVGLLPVDAYPGRPVVLPGCQGWLLEGAAEVLVAGVPLVGVAVDAPKGLVDCGLDDGGGLYDEGLPLVVAGAEANRSPPGGA
ncbi:MAG: hypothetical protein DWQ31_02025 [Planctomycetota bacterium]|nr:MAG: hypothetical protein DWQ31_02025 [Planctomycetota bacterium]REJ95407.1 MAG: hypothetical protein DWQ35_06690 [Planctomycetota bacterium]REK46056.1 MAG: hypothetical protein DWQ46_07335 [Planctomycetota bacterium]